MLLLQCKSNCLLQANHQPTVLSVSHAEPSVNRDLLIQIHQAEYPEARISHLAMTMSPVSYTHLDVYKRQEVHTAVLFHEIYGRCDKSIAAFLCAHPRPLKRPLDAHSFPLGQGVIRLDYGLVRLGHFCARHLLRTLRIGQPLSG